MLGLSINNIKPHAKSSFPLVEFSTDEIFKIRLCKNTLEFMYGVKTYIKSMQKKICVCFL